MGDEEKLAPEREGVLYFGAMGAGLSHELSNIFNIINELAGLQQDIVAAAAEGGSAGLARVADLAARIKSQVGRGEQINRSLHRLSHSVDDTDVEFDLGEALVLFGSLAARAARLAEVGLDIRPPEAAIASRGSPFALLLALHACVRVALAAASSQRRIAVWTEDGPDGVRVIVSSADTIPGLTGDPSIAATLASGCRAFAVGPRAETTPGGESRIILDLGARSAAAAAPENERRAEV
jgi:C4-dicarboxylate-specific signal transduction histidine kinase